MARGRTLTRDLLRLLAFYMSRGDNSAPKKSDFGTVTAATPAAIRTVHRTRLLHTTQNIELVKEFVRTRRATRTRTTAVDVMTYRLVWPLSGNVDSTRLSTLFACEEWDKYLVLVSHCPYSDDEQMAGTPSNGCVLASMARRRHNTTVDAFVDVHCKFEHQRRRFFACCSEVEAVVARPP
ncbi:hypothetical protein H257_06874 [Aphanomyces astaci]|uniref:Uncharacterized protein n=1 Tax=Aphanomyces astaci TaxID=112090 RepID=W4GKR8_APHAT|nr:hypothetical protein H257_06874 [Aphanomyces astaci]ETV79614.1 hypothetical protein H257_06874 [Aphanomyces astaci]|eukprot:XP_009830550.1 hypothetical protein H257_06874 [Aphanomyces astaci]